MMKLLLQKKVKAENEAKLFPEDINKQQLAMAATREFHLKLFVITRQSGKASWFGWSEYFSLIGVTDYARNIYSKTDDAASVPSLKKVMKLENNKKGAVVCNLCWSSNISEKWIFLVGEHFSTSNLTQHLKSHHKNVPEISNDNVTDTSTTKANPLKQNLLLQFTTTKNVLAENKLAMHHLYNFFNASNIAIQQSNNNHFIKYINVLIDHCSKYRHEKDRPKLFFSRYKYKQQELAPFSNFIRMVENIVKFSKEYYSKKLNTNSTPFINVLHDGWDSKDNDVLGVSIHFIIPIFWKVINVAIGLEQMESKKSADVSQKIINIINRYNIDIHDVFRGINDTTSSAK
jgi:hypothetical protein